MQYTVLHTMYQPSTHTHTRKTQFHTHTHTKHSFTHTHTHEEWEQDKLRNTLQNMQAHHGVRSGCWTYRD